MKSLIIALVMSLFSGSSFGGDTTVRDIPGSEPRVYLVHQHAARPFMPHHPGGFHPASPHAYRPVYRPAFRVGSTERYAPVPISLPSFEVADREMDLHAVVPISLPSFEVADREMQLTEALRISVPSFELADKEMSDNEPVQISLPNFLVADQEITVLMNGSGK